LKIDAGDLAGYLRFDLHALNSLGAPHILRRPRRDIRALHDGHGHARRFGGGVPAFSAGAHPWRRVPAADGRGDQRRGSRSFYPFF